MPSTRGSSTSASKRIALSSAVSFRSPDSDDDESSSLEPAHPKRRFHRSPTPFPPEYSNSESKSEDESTPDDNLRGALGPDEVLERLRSTFKLQELMPLQRKSIEATMNGKDVFLTAPTAAGKSLYYQLPACLLAAEGKGATVGIIPLRALIKEIAEKLRSLKIPVQVLDEGTTLDLRKHLVVILLTPEKLLGKDGMGSPTLETLKKLDADGGVALLAIDEAHYGLRTHAEFRPAFGKLNTLRRAFPRVPIVAMIASITDFDRTALIKTLNFQKPAVITASTFNRPNISYAVERKISDGHGIKRILKFIAKRRKECGIVYSATIGQCIKVAEALQEAGLKVGICHGELGEKDREQVVKSWLEKKIKVMVATNSFGLGVDRHDVRWVIHFTLPQSSADLYQESGRCGRDGKSAKSLVLYSHSDASLIDFIIHNSHTTRASEDLRRVKKLLLDQKTCRRTMLLLESCGEEFDAVECLATCDNCSQSIPRASNVTAIAREIVALVEATSRLKCHMTMIQIVNFVRGTCNTKDLATFASTKLPQSAEGPLYCEEDLKYLIANLIADQYLVERHERTKYSVVTRLNLGPQGESLCAGASFSYKLTLSVEPLKTAPKKRKRRVFLAGKEGASEACRRRKLAKDAYAELKPLKTSGISKATLMSLARLLPTDADELAESRILSSGAKLEPLWSWYFESGARQVMKRFAAKRAQSPAKFPAAFKFTPPETDDTASSPSGHSSSSQEFFSAASSTRSSASPIVLRKRQSADDAKPFDMDNVPAKRQKA